MFKPLNAEQILALKYKNHNNNNNLKNLNKKKTLSLNRQRLYTLFFKPINT